MSREDDQLEKELRRRKGDGMSNIVTPLACSWCSTPIRDNGNGALICSHCDGPGHLKVDGECDTCEGECDAQECSHCDGPCTEKVSNCSVCRRMDRHMHELDLDIKRGR